MFVARKANGAIYGTWTVPQTPEQATQGESHADWLPDDHPDVVAFLNRERPVATLEQRLSRAGLSIVDLKQALGLE